MKMTLRTDEIGHVTLSYDDLILEKRVTRVFMCPLDGGYVREYRDNDWKQVCDKLGNMGQTLTAPSRADLDRVIRREYQAMRRSHCRELGDRAVIAFLTSRTTHRNH
jgi:hypothetical protein